MTRFFAVLGVALALAASGAALAQKAVIAVRHGKNAGDTLT